MTFTSKINQLFLEYMNNQKLPEFSGKQFKYIYNFDNS